MYARIIALIGLVSVSVCSFAADATKSILPIQEWHTANGVRVLWVALPQQPIVDVSVLFHAGSAQDGQAFGLANLTANLLDEGTKTLSADQVAEDFDNNVAIFGAGASRDSTTVSLRSLSDPSYLTPALKTFTAVLNQPSFPEASVTRVKNETLQAIASDEESPDGMAARVFYKNLYGTHPYAHSVLGDKNTIQAMNRTAVENFYHHYYNANNALVVIVGDVDETKVHTIAEQLVGHLPSGEKAPAIPDPNNIPANKDVTVDFPTTQSSIRIGTLGIARGNPDFYAITVGNYILGGGSFVSRLYQNVREKQGLSYGVTSGFTTLQQPGPFSIILQTQNASREQAIKTVDNTLSDFIATGPTADEVSLAQNNIIGSFPLALSGNDNISNAVAIVGFYNLPLDYLDHYRDNVAGVTLNDVNQAMNKYLKGKPLLTVVVTETNANKDNHG